MVDEDGRRIVQAKLDPAMVVHAGKAMELMDMSPLLPLMVG